jgi:type IV pilus assembly protein PilE
MKQDFIMTTPSGGARATGFSLVELMITIMVGAILVSIAVPAYTTQIRKTRRTEARTAVLDLASREERYLSVSNQYSNKDTDLGYGTTGNQINGLSVGSGYYTVKVVVVQADAAGNTPAAYTITATATGIQAKDTDCNIFTVVQTGATTSTNSGGSDSSAICWK